MSHGIANTLVLYTKEGQPVEVVLQNGAYKLASSDERTHHNLDEIKLLLARVIELLEAK